MSIILSWLGWFLIELKGLQMFLSLLMMALGVLFATDDMECTSNLYNESQVLNELEQTSRKLQQNQHEESRRVFEQKLTWHKQDVRHLKDVSLWNQTYDKIVGLLARTICTIFAWLCTLFGDSAVRVESAGCLSEFYSAVGSSFVQNRSGLLSGPIDVQRNRQMASGPLHQSASSRSSAYNSGPTARIPAERKGTPARPGLTPQRSTVPSFSPENVTFPCGASPGRLFTECLRFSSSASVTADDDICRRIIHKTSFCSSTLQGTIMTISKDRVKPSPLPDGWKLAEIFATGIVLGSYLAIMTVIFFWAAYKTDFFLSVFKVPSLRHTEQDYFKKLASAVYLQVSTISQALIFVTRSRSWSFVERPGLLLGAAFLVAQLIATLLAVYVNWAFAAIEGIGWGWAGVIWLYNIVSYIPLDILKFVVRYALSGRAWNLVMEKRIAFTRQKNFGKEVRELKWAHAQRSLHGLHSPNTKMFGEGTIVTELNQMAEDAKRRAEIARLRELHTLKGRVESVVKLKGLDIEKIQQAYTL